MAVKFFGQFLMEEGVISRETLLKAIELQESANLKFGEIALSLGILKETDIIQVHDAQRTEDFRFGDMAVKLGLITEEQMKQILTKQKNSHLYIGEALVKIGGLNEEDLHRYLSKFKADQAPYMVEKISIPQEISYPQVWEIVADLTYKILTRVVNLSVRPGPCQLVKALSRNEVVAAMDFSGSTNGRYLLSVSSGIQTAIAQAILKEENVEHEPKEVLDDAVMEFVNIVCGNVAAKAAQVGKSIDISPPEVFHPDGNETPVPSGQIGLLFPLYMADGEKVEPAVFIKQ
jgi:CheY-specific phosphatase CheX/uncharacterized protein YlaN (UPF0358 family)